MTHGGEGGRLYPGNPQVAMAAAEPSAQTRIRELREAAGQQTAFQPLRNPQRYLKVSAVTVAMLVFRLTETAQYAHTSCVLKTP